MRNQEETEREGQRRRRQERRARGETLASPSESLWVSPSLFEVRGSPGLWLSLDTRTLTCCVTCHSSFAAPLRNNILFGVIFPVRYNTKTFINILYHRLTFAGASPVLVGSIRINLSAMMQRPGPAGSGPEAALLYRALGWQLPGRTWLQIRWFARSCCGPCAFL